MIYSCAHCGAPSNYLQDGFDRAQCLQCGGFTDYQGRATVPTSALQPGATWDGPGKELIPDPNRPDITQGSDPTPQLAHPVEPVVTPHPTQPADEGVLPTPEAAPVQASPRALDPEGNEVTPEPTVMSSPDTGNPAPGGETQEGTPPLPVQPADQGVVPAPETT